MTGIIPLLLLFLLSSASRSAVVQQVSPGTPVDNTTRRVSFDLFVELEELARIVDITYCVGLAGTGIQKPFSCLSRCSDFESFELLTTWNTGPLLSDSCGYIALSHPPSPKRILVAFRGTYSIANAIVDLSTVPQQYIPYPAGNESSAVDGQHLRRPGRSNGHGGSRSKPSLECSNCTVHMGFYQSWLNTRSVILTDLANAIEQYPEYELVLVGHSLGGAVCAIAALEFEARGWKPKVTTFGEPRIGNDGLTDYIDRTFRVGAFALSQQPVSVMDALDTRQRYRRVTHVNDPIPLLPLEEWGYRMHSGEIFISKSELPPTLEDLEHCVGDEDPKCVVGRTTTRNPVDASNISLAQADFETRQATNPLSCTVNWGGWAIPKRFRLWQLLFAHRDYFSRLGLCVPGGGVRNSRESVL